MESALEFLRIARSHGFHDLILSMKASNPKIMIEAYRLLVERMNGEDMHYPLHLGVTEAGDGEDGRIKSSIGIGSLLLDGPEMTPWAEAALYAASRAQHVEELIRPALAEGAVVVCDRYVDS